MTENCEERCDNGTHKFRFPNILKYCGASLIYTSFDVTSLILLKNNLKIDTVIFK